MMVVMRARGGSEKRRYSLPRAVREGDMRERAVQQRSARSSSSARARASMRHRKRGAARARSVEMFLHPSFFFPHGARERVRVMMKSGEGYGETREAYDICIHDARERDDDRYEACRLPPSQQRSARRVRRRCAMAVMVCMKDIIWRDIAGRGSEACEGAQSARKKTPLFALLARAVSSPADSVCFSGGSGDGEKWRYGGVAAKV